MPITPVLLTAAGIITLTPILKAGGRGSERLGDFPKITRL